MFGNKDSKNGTDPSPASGGSGGGVNTIDASTEIVGNLKAGGDIRIDGKLKGNLDCQARLILGPKGHIEGDVVCVNATIEGTFVGNIQVKEMLTLQATAKVTGDIKAKKMAALGGFQVDGTCQVPFTGGAKASGKGEAKATTNPLKAK